MRFVWPTKAKVDAAAEELAEAQQAALDECRVPFTEKPVRWRRSGWAVSSDAEQANRYAARCKEKHTSLKCRYGIGQGYTLWSATASAQSADWSLIRECFLWRCRHCGELTGWETGTVVWELGSDPVEHYGSPCRSCCEPQFLPETYAALCTVAQLSGPELLLRLIEQVSDGSLLGLDGAPEIPPSEPKMDDSMTEVAA
jgi:hypothetical protein